MASIGNNYELVEIIGLPDKMKILKHIQKYVYKVKFCMHIIVCVLYMIKDDLQNNGGLFFKNTMRCV